MSSYLTGAFASKQAAQEGIKRLRASGFSPKDLTVFSGEPVEFPRGVLDRPSHMSLAVVLGAVVSLILTVSFVYFTQYNYRLVTGGMPIFSGWPTAVVFFEMTMLGSILSTLVCFIWESGLLRRDKRIPVPVIESEWIAVRVRCAAERQAEVVALFEEAGAHKVGKLGEAT